MDCKLVSSKLVRYLDEDLPARVYEEITDHLEHCYLCSEEFHELVSVTDLARETLRCGEYRDGYDRLRAQLKLEAEPDNLIYLPPRLQALKTVLNAMAVAAAMVLFIAAVGLPAVEAFRTVGEAIDAQTSGRGPIIAPCHAQGPSLVAWSGQIRWAESLSNGFEYPEAQPAEQAPATEEPLSQSAPSTPPAAAVRPFCRSGVIALV